MLETIIGSAVVAAVITAVAGFISKRFENKREDEVRRIERLEARNDRKFDIDLEDRRERARVEATRLEKRQADARAQAQKLLRHLEGLQAEFEKEGTLRPYETYRSSRAVHRSITSEIRLIPDAEFREYAELARQVISEMWVCASVGEGPEHSSEVQKDILLKLLEQVGRYITDDGWDRSSISELRAAKDAIDECWDDYHAKT
jgi:O6-methylguanine-DNA--protein-cysteine methyltransferase